MINRKARRKRTSGLVFLLVLMLISGLTACLPDPSTPTTAISQETQLETAAVNPTETPPASTATSETARVILAAGEDVDQAALAEVQTALEPLAAGDGLLLVTQSGLTSAELSSGVRIVIGLGTSIDLAGLAAGAPSTQFVGVGNPALTSGPNLSVIGDPVADRQRLSFMAGYLAALISDDYKMAALVVAGDETGAQAADSFVVGARFFCGLCQPKYPPYGVFPKWDALPPASDVSAWGPVVDTLVLNGVEVVYIQDPVASAALFSFFSDQGITIISDAPLDMPRMNWAGTLQLDPIPALLEVWSQLLSGTGGHTLPMTVRLIETDAGLVSEGRFRLFEETLSDLEAGLIAPAP